MKLNKLILGLALLMVAFVACEKDDENEPGGVQSINITVSDLTATSAVVSFPVLEDAHNYTAQLYDAEGEWVDMDFATVGMFSSDNVKDGVATLDAFEDLTPSSKYKVVVEGTENVLTEGVVTLAKDSVEFTTLAE